MQPQFKRKLIKPSHPPLRFWWGILLSGGFMPPKHTPLRSSSFGGVPLPFIPNSSGRIFKRRGIKFFPAVKTVIILTVFIIIIFSIYKLVSPFNAFLVKEGINKEFIENLISKDPKLKNYKNKTNILLLGISGGERESAKLTDTILVVSIDTFNSYAVMISIPRDLWLDSLKDKINSAYFYGEKKKEGGGNIMAKAAVEEVIGQPIHYVNVIDFSGFKELIDLIGGVDINIEKGFIDKFYPIAGRENDLCGGDKTFLCRYDVIEFKEGIEHMDGDRALKYVRSRQASGDEGTDFDRARRQQQIITAVKNKIINREFIISNLRRIKDLYISFKKIVKTDMSLAEQILTFKAFRSIDENKIRRIVLDTGDVKTGRAGLLTHPSADSYNGEWVLIPEGGNFEKIHDYISCELILDTCGKTLN